jgi:acyl-CoA synthetase (AMP-forming)/AMP-acid ligase II
MSIVNKIRDEVENHPNAIALEWLHPQSGHDVVDKTTYCAMWERANLIAQGLRVLVPSFSPPALFDRSTCLISPNTSLVGVLLDEGSDLAFLFLGILISRMVVLPLDPDDPVERLRLALQDSKPSVVVVKVVSTLTTKQAEQTTQQPPLWKQKSLSFVTQC